MAKIDKRYEKVYAAVRTVASTYLKELEECPDGAVVVTAAQAEAFVRTLRFSLRTLKRNYHAKYLHKLMSQMLREILDGMGHLEGVIVIREGRKKRPK